MIYYWQLAKNQTSVPPTLVKFIFSGLINTLELSVKFPDNKSANSLYPSILEEKISPLLSPVPVALKDITFVEAEAAFKLKLPVIVCLPSFLKKPSLNSYDLREPE